MMKDEQKILILSIIGGLSTWIIDSVVDFLVFNRGSFWGALLFDISGHELYFRTLFLVSFVLFGLFISRSAAKHKRVDAELKKAVTKIEDEKAKSEAIIAAMGDGISMQDTDFKVVYQNQVHKDLVGGDKTGEYCYKAYGGNDSICPGCPAADSFKDGKVHTLEKSVPKGNETQYIEIKASPLMGSTGKIVAGIEIVRDITERKRAEGLIKESEKKYKNLVELTTDIIYASDKDGRQVFMNDAAYKILGYAPEDVIGKPLINLIHPDDREKTLYKRKEMIERGIDVFNFENRYMAKDGRAIGVLHNVRVRRNEKGEIIGTQGIARDITERKQTEEKLNLFSEAIEEAMDGVQIVDLNGYIIYSNKAVEEIYGFTANELIGKHVNDMNSDKEFASRVIIPSIKETGRWNGELMVMRKNGREFPIWLSTSLVKNEKGEPIAMVGIIRDITKRKQAEDELKRYRDRLEELVIDRTAELTKANKKLLQEIAEREKVEAELLSAQKLESLGILAGGIAHDFNNLLASIMGNISLAMMDLKREDRPYKQLVNAENASLRARDLTQQLLTFSKGGEPVKTITSLGELIKESAGFALRGSKVRYELSLPDDLWPVEADEGQMTQVLNNLIINADQAMPEGGTVKIYGENVALGAHDIPPLKGGNYVKISVEDHGIGIHKEYLMKIFDPYFTTKQKGSGLGLAVTYSIIKKHEGHIAIESEPGVGTTFHVYLPAFKERRQAKRVEDKRLYRGKEKILVMDDEEGIRQTSGDILTRLGYEVEFAEDGLKAIEMYREAQKAGKPFDVVIMDLTVAGGTGGKEAIRKLLEINPNAKAIVSSGYSKDPVMADYKTYGFKGVVAKPYRIKELSEAVYKVINSSR